MTDPVDTEKQPDKFCKIMDTWAGLAVAQKGNLTPGFDQAWGTVRLAIGKSCLLDRMMYGGEWVSQTPCPVHKGRWSGVNLHPGQFGTQLVDHGDYKRGDRVPVQVDSVRQAEYDAGCRCFQHKSCGCTTGWLPDKFCGCVDD